MTKEWYGNAKEIDGHGERIVKKLYGMIKGW